MAIVLALLAASLAAPPRAGACDLCAIYTGSLLQQEKTGLFLGIAEQYSDFDNVHEDGSHEVPNTNHEWIHSSITQLVGGWSFRPWIGAQVNVPLISRSYRRLEDGLPNESHTGGLGDLSALLRVSPYQGETGPLIVHTELLAGLKLPTGSGHFLKEELPVAHDGEDVAVSGFPRHGDDDHSVVGGHDLALGSGSVDGVFGATAHASWNRFFAEAAVQYIVRGNGDYSYEFANDLTWEAGPGFYLVTRHEWTAALQLTTTGENKGRDHQKGQLLDDTAITAVYLGPGLTVTWRDDLHADLAVDLPLHQDVTGAQLVPDYRLRAGLVWRF
jgi:hypothetical protein